MYNWIDKYRPKTLSEVIGHRKEIAQLEKFIGQFKGQNVENPNIIVIGPNGIGKTLIVDLILQKYQYTKFENEFSNLCIRSSDNKVNSLKSFYLLISGNKLVQNKIALVIDDLSNMNSPKIKDAIKGIIRLNSQYKKFPIIIITNTKHNKIINELRKVTAYQKKSKYNINEINLRIPDFDDVLKFVQHICKNENLQLEDEDLYTEIIAHSQYDLRRLVTLLENLAYYFSDRKISRERWEYYQEISKTKDVDPGIYEATRLLLDEYLGVNRILAIYGEERATIPLMIHENYTINLFQDYPHMDARVRLYLLKKIISSISYSDYVDGLIYSNQYWNLQDVHGFYSCVLPSYWINYHPNKLHKLIHYNYTQDYNKTSIRKINHKIIKKVQENISLKKISIEDFLEISDIFKTLVERKDYLLLKDIIDQHKLTVRDLENIIKIDKINRKPTMTCKQRNTLKVKLENFV
jgi:DNA polymerase III delta prime subunit